MIRWLILLVLAAGSFLSRADHPESGDPVPSPCDQLERQDYQEICARFLADIESSGGHTFSIADTASGFDEFKSKLEDDKNYAGLILLLTDDIEIVCKPTLDVAPRGIVAILGNPDNPARINFTGKKGETPIYLAPDPKTGATVKPQAFYCWGVKWVLNDLLRLVIFVFQHYGHVHITHSIFGYTTPIKKTYNPGYIYVSLEDTPGRTVNNSVLIAHNHFTNVPAGQGKHKNVFDISIHCMREIPDSHQGASTCHQLGEVVIRDNIWQSPPELSAGEFPEEDSGAAPDPFDPIPYRSAVSLVSIAKLTFSGNSAADKDAVLSVLALYTYYNGNQTNIFNNLNLQLVNNVAEPGMNATHRQFYLNGLLDNGGNRPFAGLVNMTCNPDFNVVRTGGFAYYNPHNLTIIQANDDCTGPTVIPTTVTATTLPASMTATVTSPYATATISVSSVLPSVSSASPAPSHAASPDGGTVANIIIYSAGAGAGGLVLALTAWEAIWITAYWHSGGNFQTFAGVMALFIPFCFRYLLSRKTAGSGYPYARVPID